MTRNALDLLDWIMSRRVHEYLDAAGRPIGEGRSAAIAQVQTEMQRCPYVGSRHHHAKPMNVSALRQITPLWEKTLTMLSWLGQRYRACHQKDVTTYDDLTRVTSAGVFLADFMALRVHRPVRSRDFPVLVSGLYKVCLGFQLATFMAIMQERFDGSGTVKPLPNPTAFYAYLEEYDLLIGEAEVCAGSPAMIMEAYSAMTFPHNVTEDALPADCTNLQIAWEQFDVFSDHATRTWSDLVDYAIETLDFCPQLAAPRIPESLQERLNARLQKRAKELQQMQRGLVVDIARQAMALGEGSASMSEPEGPPTQAVRPRGESLAHTILKWLHNVAAADMERHEKIVAHELEMQLAPYELREATVLGRLNRHLSCLQEALGRDAADPDLSASALSHLFGRTLRDW